MKEQEVASPCVKICEYDKVSGICLGCHRTKDEITIWKQSDNRVKKEILKAVKARKSLIFKSL